MIATITSQLLPNFIASHDFGTMLYDHSNDFLILYTSSHYLQANFARWEPGHGRFRFRHPWKQYLKIGALARQCAYRIEALNGYINSDIQVLLHANYRRNDVSFESGKTIIVFCAKYISDLYAGYLFFPTSVFLKIEPSHLQKRD